jgi:hypothetical protein
MLSQSSIHTAQTMKVIEKINKEFEQITKQCQQEYDQIREQQR